MDEERIAYKLIRIKNGKLYPIFINRQEETVMNEWLEAECHPTKGFAIRTGWHCCFFPIAPHLKEILANGEQRVWVECRVKNYMTYIRPAKQGGSWILAEFLCVKKILSADEINEIRAAARCNKLTERVKE